MNYPNKIRYSFLVLFIIILSACTTNNDVQEKKENERPEKDVQVMVPIKKSNEELVIRQNLPEVNANSNKQEVHLDALKIYKDGHFVKTKKVQWKSTNEEIATVDEKGIVKATGKVGQSKIIAEREGSMDYITIKMEEKNGNPRLIKEQGEDYQIAERAIKGMTLEEKLGQMMMPDFRYMNGQNVTQLLPEVERMIRSYHIGGVILFRENIVSTEQSTALIEQMQRVSNKYKLLMTIDQEGGSITRFQAGTDMPGNMALGATRSNELSEKVGKTVGEELKSLGFNMNFAPSLDVNNNAENPVIGVRSYGGNPDLVANMGLSYINGLQSTDVSATAKHFPGHGDTNIDSHVGLPIVSHDMERLKSVELYPFQKAMDNGLDAIMTTHITFPNLDSTSVISQKTGERINLPATLSKKILTDLVRDEMKFKGVIVTDAMNMGAISKHYGTVEAAIKTIQAGTDIVLMPGNMNEIFPGLVEAVEKGVISEDRLNESAKRILELKLKRGIVKEEQITPVEEKINNAIRIVGSNEHKAVEKEAAEKSITLVKNEKALPLTSLSTNDRIVVIGNRYIQDLGNAIKEKHPNTQIVEFTNTTEMTEAQKKIVKSANYIIYGSFSTNVEMRSETSSQIKIIKQVMNITNVPVIAVAIHNPYDIMAYPEVDAYITQYGFNKASFDATASVIFGEYSPIGKLPVIIPNGKGGILYDYGQGLSY